METASKCVKDFIDSSSDVCHKNVSLFETVVLKVFRHQYSSCEPYRRYLGYIGTDPDSVTSIETIPFLPVQFFKSEDIYSGNSMPEKVFTSSATTGMEPSHHPVSDISLYESSFLNGFRIFYGDPVDYVILALLPSYLEREGSSLVYMADKLIRMTGSSESGFYLNNRRELFNKITSLRKSNKKVILLGVSFALLDFANEYKIEFPELIVMETGGMKGRGKEIERDELHKILKNCFGVENIHSEYGMAELLSQAYSSGDGVFQTPPWMEILIRDLNNPFRIAGTGKRGGINIIDLANVNSCSFIETEDMGIKTAGNGFKILGRIKNSELRGCNLLLG
ncbi:MAG: hypothetical protein ACD_77C00476G0009 [uncultured bacterium]|nr:MAG: hypothetical protein ACD_77C00476G0009 [uncultured bacterium]HBY01533.1 acyl transferase [Rikenellaceae bacterium]